VLAAASVLGLWLAMHRISWLGPLLADTGRAVVGPRAVGAIEDFAYGLDDRWQRFWRRNEAPTAYWEVPTVKSNAEQTRPVLASGALAYQPDFPPADVGPVHASMQAPGDGVWVPIVPDGVSAHPPLLAKTLVHPDQRRPWSAVAIVAIDLARVDLHLKAGQYVPIATEPEAQSIHRPGLIPVEHQQSLIAAFNGGFKTTHGRLGMRADGVTLIRPRSFACTLARFEDGTVDLATWTGLMPRVTEIDWYRQTPRCLVEHGKRAEGLDNPHLADWGSAVSGSTIIRRSAIGISEGHTTLFYALGESISAANIALALTHVGAVTVAQLDVNGTLPKFLTYDRVGPGRRLMPRGLIDTVTFTRDEYVREPAPRDFFYITTPKSTRT
jgi:hypothetical protein